MATAKSQVPKGYSTVTPYLRIKGAEKALAFYAKAFGAKERMKLVMPDGRIGHAEIEIGQGGLVMLSDEFPEMGIVGPATLSGTTVSIMVYVPDCDKTFKSAIAAGAKELRPPKDEFYGDRSGQVTDPFGHVWSIQTHIKDIPPRDLQRMMDEAMKAHGSGKTKSAKPAARKKPTRPAT